MKRFEEDRMKFEMEKRKYDKEREMEKQRYRRLEEFERKRISAKLKAESEAKEAKLAADHEKLYQIMRVIEDNKTHLPAILKSENIECELPLISTNETVVKPIPPPRRIDVPVFHAPDPPPLTPDICDDYESSTAVSSSSREDDFNDDDFAEITEIERNGKLTENHEQNKSDIANELNQPIAPVKRSFFAKLFGRKPISQPPPTVIATKPVDKLIQRYNRTPPSMKRFIFIESRLVWRKLLLDHPEECRATKAIFRKCIADFVLMSIYWGMGGMVFRFVEGSFENFYKCGVKRVKRDFVDQLWRTSHNLRCLYILLIS